MKNLLSHFGIIRSTPSTIHPPEVSEVSEQESTLQLPFGNDSVLSELFLSKISPIQAILYLSLNYRSNWSTGHTWRSSHKQLSELLGVSESYVRQTIQSMSDWIRVRTASRGNVAATYTITHHNCAASEVPTDKDGEPSSFAIPRGSNGILEKMFAGVITWQEALIWIILKLRSDWVTGITDAMNMETLSKLVRMGKSTVCKAIGSLVDNGLLKRLSKIYECSVFQLIPKPYKERKKRKRKRRSPVRQMRREGDYCYSLNELYRVNVETGKIEHRAALDKGIWQGISDYHRASEMPKVILEDFDKVRTAYFELKSNLGSSDSADSSSDSAGGSSDSADSDFQRRSEGTPLLTSDTS